MNNALDTWKRTGIVPYHQEDYIPFHADYEYLRWVEPILNRSHKPDRTGTGGHEFFGTPQTECDLSLGFPLLTTKNVHFNSIKVETLWYLRGDTNIKYLLDNKVTIWNEWATTEGEVGPLYGAQWTKWKKMGGIINQIENLIAEIKRAPYSKGMFVTSWNPAEIGFDCVKLRPCHGIFQCSVSTDETIDLKMNQRSADWFLGVPFNIGSYALLLQMIAQVTGYKAGRVMTSYGSAHIYVNHMDQMKEQLTRDPRPLPRVELNPDIKNIFDFKLEDIILKEYDPHPKLKGVVAI
ncbi:MAG: thymidylate synthase [Candidatus Nomurabacteria bacterium]|jgi:thymidylate synthase|nr:thymidylate synthase [Candidatus Nomurabacteria bacterium]